MKVSILLIFLMVGICFTKNRGAVIAKFQEKPFITPILNVQPMGEKNIVWCASYQAVWQMLKEIIGEDINLNENDSVVNYLNAADDILNALPAAGTELFLVQNADTLYKFFNGQLFRNYEIKPMCGANLLAYCFLNSEIQFSYPYKTTKKRSIVFNNENGTCSRIPFYGIRSKDYRRQAGILYSKKMNPKLGVLNTEFAIELNRNDTINQIVLASVPKGNMTLIQLYEKVQNGITELRNRGISSSGLSDYDVLLFPAISFDFVWQFENLSNKTILNETFKGTNIYSEQTINFKLDNKGVKLKSEASIKTLSSGYQYIFDKPFLLYMKKRNVEMPYLVMWVANLKNL
jgi:hypothetical protein